MSNDPIVLQLIEEALESGRPAEEVCADHPALVRDVRAGVRRCRNVDAQLAAMFPPSSSGALAGGRRFGLDPGLPDIPGYRVESVLGRGGMGIVYRARQLTLDRTVAVKMMLSGAFASQGELARFLREAQAVARLRHPHVVQVFDAGELDGRPYFAMEFVGGPHLGQKLNGVPQPARDAAALVAALAGAVSAAHDAGIIHRDLKPANILIASDGTPKVTDFGLARDVIASGDDDANALTASGARVGTPSYMAPEQAAGAVRQIGPATDVYALGAILYEALTGRPPFRGENAVDTERQVIEQEPVPPSRLNAKVPRDLQTICLKCLQKSPGQRYPTAAALADDLRRFLAGDPITARPVGPIERCARWARRRPALTAALAGSFALACVATALAFSLTLQRLERRHAVEADLRDVTTLQERARWSDATAALDRADARLGSGGPAAVRARLADARRDLDLVMRLDAIRLVRVTQGDPAIYRAQADRNYAAAFRAAGLAAPADDPAKVARRVRGSAVRAALVAALDDWIVCTADVADRRRLIDIVRRADPDVDGWRSRVLAEQTWDDLPALAALAKDVPVNGQPTSMLMALGDRLRDRRGESSTLLKRIQSGHPGDFWANMGVGNAMLFRAPMEAGGYYRAALASRPDAAVCYCAVGDAMRLQSAYEPALRHYRKAVELDPRYARAYVNIGLTLQRQGSVDRAIEYYRKAIPLDPDYAWGHFELANALRDVGRTDEAADHFRKAAELDPTIVRALDGVRSIEIRRGHVQEVWAQWRDRIAADPANADDWVGYAQLSLYLGHDDEYRRARGEMLARFAGDRDPSLCERVSRACLLAPLDGDALRDAAALAHRAAAERGATDAWSYVYFLFAEGLAEYREGRLDAAIAATEGEASAATGPGPRLVDAMARQRKGDAAGARRAFAAAAASLNWSPDAADHRDQWIWHALRREAEALVLPRLTDFLAGSYDPTDADGGADERIAMTAACEFAYRYASAADLYAGAFQLNPALASDRAVGHRLKAAGLAALAGTGQAREPSPVDADARSRWRAQARAWFAADLDACNAEVDAADPPAVTVLRRYLRRWKTDPSLAGMRGPVAIAELPLDEREDTAALWSRLDATIARTERRPR